MRTQLGIALLVLTSIFLSACSVSTSLVPVLPEEEGAFGVSTEVRQPFYSRDDGLHKLTVRFFPEGFPGSQMPVDPSQGAVVSLNYAPDADPRFPEPAFHEWPEHHEWLPELVGDVHYEQTFCSPYPDLSGIQLRVATFGADLSAGVGTLRPFETVDVLDMPIVGNHIGFLPGGSEVQVVSAVEGWALVELTDDRIGFIDFEHFVDLPEPFRSNDHDVVLELYRNGSSEPIRESTINASDMYDNSHVTFSFPIVSDSLDECFRFRVTSPRSVSGNAVTFRYDPDSTYQQGQATLDGTPVDGDLVFQPEYDLQEAIYVGSLDEYEWAAPLNAFEARFDPVPNTADRYLAVSIRSGNMPVNVPWSRIRPPGQLPLSVVGEPSAPGGGIIFNAAFQRDVPMTDVMRIGARDLYSKARMDKAFYGVFGLLLIGVAVGGAVIWRRGDPDGR